LADRVVVTQVHNTVALEPGETVRVEFSVSYQDSNGATYAWGLQSAVLELKSGPVFKTHQQLNNEIALLGRAEAEARVEPAGVLAGEFLIGGFVVTTV